LSHPFRAFADFRLFALPSELFRVAAVRSEGCRARENECNDTMNMQPITLPGRLVHLEPLSLAHVPDLTIASQDEAIWRLMPFGLVRTEEQMEAFVQDALALQARGSDLPFAVVHRETGRAIDCTRYLDIRRAHRGLEIGGTWYGVEYQRTGVNTECK
jgi:RimJ/RimL family protein N-acetyltransferase